ncbi:MAG: PHB depolymerase family esterase [Polyangiaceae bacterium]
MIGARANVMISLAVVSFCVGLSSGCSSDPGPPPLPSATADGAKNTPPVVLASASASGRVAPTPSGSPSTMATSGLTGAAAAEIRVPTTIAPGEKRPFVLYLHGLGASGEVLRKVVELDALAASKKFVYAAPDGPKNSKGQQFWNASKACCNFDGSTVDHVAELRALIERAKSSPNVDPSRIYVIGFSNGGFMAHRLACDVEGISAIASVAGAAPLADEPCSPKQPVAILQVHGDHDELIRYSGGQALSKPTLPAHPSAADTTKSWATREHCKGTPSNSGTIDFEPKVLGDETAILRYTGCDRPVELWTVQGGSHFIGTNKGAQLSILAFFDGQFRP